MAQTETPAPSSSGSPGIRSLLVVDERDSSRLVTKWFLSSFGYSVDSARSADEALALFDLKLHDLVITDDCHSERQGAAMAELVKARSSATRVILFSATAPADQACCDVFVPRPGHLLLLKDAIDEVSVAG